MTPVLNRRLLKNLSKEIDAPSFSLRIYGIPEFMCMLWRINCSPNYAGILDTFLNQGYLSACFKLVVVPAVMSRQLALFGKVAASQKVCGKTTKTYKELWMLFVADELGCSPSLPLQQARLGMLLGKWPIMVRTRWLCQMFCLPVRITVSAWQRASLFQFQNPSLIRNCCLMFWH